jgi:hypothetical protein
MGWQSGSSGRTIASQAQGLEFNPHYHQKTKSKQTKIIITP